MRTTIRDIAEKTNLSITTVSLVLNNKPNKIAKSTKDKIFKGEEKLTTQPTVKYVGADGKEITPDMTKTESSSKSHGKKIN